MKINQFFSLVHIQARMKLRSQANTLTLSYLWWLLEPLLYVALFYFVFKFILYRGGDNFFLFLMVGKIPFLWFSKAVNSCSNSLNENRGLIAQRPMPKLMFPLINTLESLYKQPLSFAVIVCTLLFIGVEFELWWLQLPILLILQFILIFGVGSFFAITVTLFPDFRMIIQLFMLGLMFTSGIFWNVNLIQDPEIRHLLMVMNPVAALIEGFRDLFIYEGNLEYKYLLAVLGWGLSSIAISWLLISKLNNTLTRRIIS